MKSGPLMLCGALAGPIFVVLFSVIGALRADYDWQRHPVSSLALEGWGWTQVGNFLVTGVLLVLFAIGLWHAMREPAERKGTRLGPLLVGLMGIGLIGAGIFPTDPLGGYPPGTPERIVYTPAGVFHDAFSMLFFVGLPLACFTFAVWFARRGKWVWTGYSVITAVAFLATFVLAGLGFEQQPGFAASAGLMQRLCVVIGFAWVSLLALYLRGRLV
jgi:hypothetical membrane protein